MPQHHDGLGRNARIATTCLLPLSKRCQQPATHCAIVFGLRSLDPNFFRHQNEDISAKWKRDTVRMLRSSAIAMLMDDPDTLRERFLFWFKTIMKAFGAQKSCNATYEVMQEVVKQQLPLLQASLFCPILEINRLTLGKT